MKNISLKLLLLLALFSQTSCASYKNKIGETMNQNRKTLQLTNNYVLLNADFTTYAELMGQSFGLVGAAIASTYSKGIVDISHAKDPANEIKKSLGKVLAKQYNLKIIDGEKDFNLVTKKDAASMLTNFRQGDVVLDIYSYVGGMYYPFRLDNFKVIYTSEATMADRETNSIIFKSQCVYDKEKDDDNTLNDIATKPEIISKVLKYAQEFCTEKFLKEISVEKETGNK